jgi:hypothetical protein
VLVAWLAKALVATGQVAKRSRRSTTQTALSEDTTLHYNRAALLARKGHVDEAVASCERWLRRAASRRSTSG